MKERVDSDPWFWCPPLDSQFLALLFLDFRAMLFFTFLFIEFCYCPSFPVPANMITGSLHAASHLLQGSHQSSSRFTLPC